MTDADITIYKSNTFDERKKSFSNIVSGVKDGINNVSLPNLDVFSSDDMPDSIFNSFGHELWSKLFKTSFIRENNINFPDMYFGDDKFFACLSLATAKRITIVDEVLLYYRVGIASITTKLDRISLDFYYAELKLMHNLKERHLYEKVEKSFLKSLLSSTFYNLNSQKTYNGFKNVYNHLIDNFDTDFNIFENKDYLISQGEYYSKLLDNYKLMLENTENQYLELKEKNFVNILDNSTKISVIIPVYNVEKYLRDCLDSVINQTLKEIEIICINDGSTDNSIEILREYATQDNRIVILNQSNKGLSAARNKGISIAKGIYTYFLDSDDMIAPYALEKMFVESTENNLDMLFFDPKIIFENKLLELKSQNKIDYFKERTILNQVCTGREIFTEMIKENSYIVQASTYLTKTNFLKNTDITFTEGFLYEDNLFMFKIIFLANRVKHLREKLFIYRVREDSITTKQLTEKHFYGYFVTYIEMLDHAVNNEAYYEVKEFVMYALNNLFNLAMNEYNKLPDFEKIQVGNTTKIESNKFIFMEHNNKFEIVYSHIKQLELIGLKKFIPITIVFIGENSQIRNLSISIISLLENSNISSSYLIYLLHQPSYSKNNIEVLLNIQKKYSNCKILFKEIQNLYCDNYKEITNMISKEFINIDKCIYLNSNVVVQKDLFELINTNIDGFGVGAVKSTDLVDIKAFDLNVLLVDIKIINKHNFNIKEIDLKFNLSAKYFYNEKTFNFSAKIRMLPILKEYFELKQIKSAITENYIFSYSDEQNPFNDATASFSLIWWKYFRMSPLIKTSKSICKKPKVSVIIPVYNVSNYLEECLDSIVNQTLEEIEIICIDDGSTDNSLEIIKNYAEFDNRIIILQKENGGLGAGAARNMGIEIAKGDYLSILDSDDFFELTMLEKSYENAIQNDSDIVIYNYYAYHMLFNQLYVPRHIRLPKIDSVFSYADIPDRIFNDLGHTAWTKFIKKEFIISNNIKFQEVYRADDLFFTNTSLILASKISVNHNFFAYYRMGINSQTTSYKYPLSFVDAWTKLKNKVESLDYYDLVKQSFLNSFLDSAIYHLNIMKGSNCFEIVYEYISNELDYEFEITEYDSEYYRGNLYKEFMLIKNTPINEYLKIKI